MEATRALRSAALVGFALSSLAGIRALVPIHDSRALRTPARLLDDAQKAVVDVVIESDERGEGEAPGGTEDGGGASAARPGGSAGSELRVDLTAVRRDVRALLGDDPRLERLRSI